MTVVLSDEVGGEYDGAVAVEWLYDPPLPEADEMTDSQLHAMAIREFLGKVFGEIPGSQTQRTIHDEL